MLPTFIIAGANKAGTTSLYEYLKLHPNICMSRVKEPCFFTNHPITSTYNNGIEWYQKLYSSCEMETTRGEASTVYMGSEDSAYLIHKTIPEVSLVFILRDPVDRMYSQYWSDKKLKGLVIRDFEDLVERQHPFIKELFNNSRYDLHLKRFMNYFPMNQLHIYLFDDLVQDTPGVADESHALRRPVQ